MGLISDVGGVTADVNVAAEVTAVGGVTSGVRIAADVGLARARAAINSALRVIGDRILEPARTGE